jgi:hypothetical protein
MSIMLIVDRMGRPGCNFASFIGLSRNITRYEEDQIFLDDSSTCSNEQAEIVSKVGRLPYLRLVGATCVMSAAILGCDRWEHWRQVN